MKKNSKQKERAEKVYQYTEDLVTKRMCNKLLQNLTFYNYLCLKRILVNHEIKKMTSLKPWSAVSGVLTVACIALSIGFSPFMAIPASIGAITLAISVAISETGYFHKYEKLYKKLKRSGELKDVEAYIVVYEQDENFEKIKNKYELGEKRIEINEYIKEVSDNLEQMEREQADLELNEGLLTSSLLDSNIEVVDERGNIHHCYGLGEAMPLIAKMLKNNTLKVELSNASDTRFSSEDLLKKIDKTVDGNNEDINEELDNDEKFE